MLKAFDDMSSLWARVDAETGEPNFTPPLVLRNNVTLANFDADLATMRTRYKAVSDAEADLKLARKQRDVLLEPLRDRLVLYRKAVEVAYGETHPFFNSLPRVYPLPGSTPDPSRRAVRLSICPAKFN